MSNTDFPATLVQQYFEQSVAKHPQRVAVSCDGESRTYAELDTESSLLAARLIESGAQPREMIPLYLPKSIDAIRAMLAVLKAGCAYIPLDIDAPLERLKQTLSVSRAKRALVSEATRDILKSVDPWLVTIDATVEASAALAEVPPSRAISVDVAYVMSTSGSARDPRGVMISHQAITDYIDWCVSEFNIDQNDRICNQAPLHVHRSTFDIYSAFKAGASVHLVPPLLNDNGPRLASWLKSNDITVFFCVPDTLARLLNSQSLDEEQLPSLRHVIFGGGAVQPKVLRRWMTQFPHARYTNMYGPTEVTGHCSFHVLKNPPEDGPVPIGRARPNMAMYVYVKSTGQLTQEPGAEGELWIRGLSVGHGYLGAPHTSEHRFVQHLKHDHFPDRLYRTGDLVQIREDGEYVFLGRIDDQVKYQGHRIELGEIEAQIASHPQVREACVVFNASAEEQLIGALVSLEEGGNVDDLRSTLKDCLPDYMLPHKLVETGMRFPRTASGDYDRGATHTMVFE